jgi:protein translocase SecG subunit
MIKVLLVLHVFVTIALIGVVLIQRSEGGGLGLGGGQGMGNFMSGRGTANLLTRTTAILGTAFFALSLVLALLYKGAVNDDFEFIATEHPGIDPGAGGSGNGGAAGNAERRPPGDARFSARAGGAGAGARARARARDIRQNKLNQTARNALAFPATHV